MAVPAAMQQQMAQTYAVLTDSITHNKPRVEETILATNFADHAKIKLAAYEYDPLTVLVQKIDMSGGSKMIVHAQWVGIGAKRENTVDTWLLVDGTWRLSQREKTR